MFDVFECFLSVVCPPRYQYTNRILFGVCVVNMSRQQACLNIVVGLILSGFFCLHVLFHSHFIEIIRLLQR